MNLSPSPILIRQPAESVTFQQRDTSVTVVNQHALELRQVSKCYRRFARQWDRVKQWLRGDAHRYYTERWAVRDVNLLIERGSTVGILGANGSGKSTLLQLIAGTLTPTSGTLGIHGRVAALLELGSGFHPEFTGWENMRLQATILGVTDEEAAQKYEQMARFSGLGEALDQPLRTYSSGMILRLGFSIAIHLDPDILLIDEALAVGDLAFQQQCMGRIRELKERGVTIVLVTHDLETTKRLCDVAHVMDRGQLVQSGNTDAVCNWYVAHLLSDKKPGTTVPAITGQAPYRHGNQQAVIEQWQWLNPQGVATTQAYLGEQQTLAVTIRFAQAIDRPVIGFYLRDRLGTELMGENTDNARVSLIGREGSRVTVHFRFGLHLRPGAYTLCLGLVDNPLQPVCLDWIDQAMTLQVHDSVSGRVVFGLFAEPIDVAIRHQNEAVQGRTDATVSSITSDRL